MVALLGSFAVAWVFEPALVARHSKRVDHPVETSFRISGESTEVKPFPSLREAPTIELTVVVPAYNEESRLSLMLEPALKFFDLKHENDQSFTYEIIVVDDGSSDGTAALVLSYVARHGSEKIRLLSLNPNQGKGAAIRKGMLRGRGRYLLMVDADGATEISDFDRLMSEMLKATVETAASAVTTEPVGLAIGSRAHLQHVSMAKRAFYRTVLMKGMHLAVAVLCTTSIKDTQCGFKLFSRRAAYTLFPQMHLERW